MRLLLIIFIATPLLEMLVLFEAAELLGAWTTLLLVILTAVIGLHILKREGISTLFRANKRLSSGELPAQEIIEAMLLAGAGVLLITPGFLTDFLGFGLLARALRQLVARTLMTAEILGTFIVSNMQDTRYWSINGQEAQFKPGDIYEGEYTNDDDIGEIEGFERKKDNKNSNI